MQKKRSANCGAAFMPPRMKSGKHTIAGGRGLLTLAGAKSCTRDPWPTWAKEFGVPMQELILCRERMIKSILEDVSIFFNIRLGIEVQKAIPRGEGIWLIRLYKEKQ